MNTVHELHPHQTLRLRHRGPLHLQVLQGRLWLTQRGCTLDHFVSAGQQLMLAAADAVVIECDSPGPARWRLLPAPAAQCRDEQHPQQPRHRHAVQCPVRHQRPGLSGRPAQ